MFNKKDVVWHKDNFLTSLDFCQNYIPKTKSNNFIIDIKPKIVNMARKYNVANNWSS